MSKYNYEPKYADLDFKLLKVAADQNNPVPVRVHAAHTTMGACFKVYPGEPEGPMIVGGAQPAVADVTPLTDDEIDFYAQGGVQGPISDAILIARVLKTVWDIIKQLRRA